MTYKSIFDRNQDGIVAFAKWSVENLSIMFNNMANGKLEEGSMNTVLSDSYMAIIQAILLIDPSDTYKIPEYMDPNKLAKNYPNAVEEIEEDGKILLHLKQPQESLPELTKYLAVMMNKLRSNVISKREIYDLRELLLWITTALLEWIRLSTGNNPVLPPLKVVDIVPKPTKVKMTTAKKAKKQKAETEYVAKAVDVPNIEWFFSWQSKRATQIFQMVQMDVYQDVYTLLGTEG